MKISIVIGVLACIVGAALALKLYDKKNVESIITNATVINPAKQLQPFSIMTEASTFSLADLKQQWTVLFFGYTYCPDICPTTLAVLKQVITILQQQPKGVVPGVVFVSVDPNRDTPAQLQQYTGYFDKAFIGATGSEAALKNLTKQLGVVYMKVSDEKQATENYFVDHSASLFLINPKGELQAVFGVPHQVDLIVEDIKKIIRAYS